MARFANVFETLRSRKRGPIPQKTLKRLRSMTLPMLEMGERVRRKAKIFSHRSLGMMLCLGGDMVTDLGMMAFDIVM